MAKTPGWWPLLLLLGIAALYVGATWFTWEVTVATGLLVLGLTSMAWLGGSPGRRHPARGRRLPSVWMLALYVIAAALVFASSGLTKPIPGVAVFIAFLLAPLPWAVLGVVGVLKGTRSRRGSRDHREGPAPQA